MNDFTDRQARILRYLRAWVADHGEPPTVRQLAEGVGLSSPSSAHYQLSRLEACGAVRRTGGRHRSWITC
ncbi:LexA family protein [Streptomyces xantholiticus]|uniref:MarR family transcriptional regulator n=1 Tax=Streptomyces xantholiticus TaxID=68285 RepID=A0ABV1UZW7_9ACTN